MPFLCPERRSGETADKISTEIQRINVKLTEPDFLLYFDFRIIVNS
jgi:hypothetical protein